MKLGLGYIVLGGYSFNVLLLIYILFYYLPKYDNL